MKQSWPGTVSPESARRFRIGPEWQLVAYLWACYLLNHADRQVVYTLFPALQKEFGYSDAAVGLTGALFLWVYGLCSPAAGILGDRISKAKLVVASLGVWSAITVISGFSPNGVFLLACRALLGVSESLFMPAGYGLMAAAHGPQSRSRAIAIFGTSQLLGVAIGGSLSGFIAERLHWRASFWILGTAGILFTIPLSRFFRRMPQRFQETSAAAKARPSDFFRLFRIPSLLIVTLFVSTGTFALFLVYSWLPTFLYDKFHLSLTRAGFEASVFTPIGHGLGLLVGGIIADRGYGRTHASRFWVITGACFGAAPCIFLLGAAPTLAATRFAAIAFGFFAGWIAGNQAAAAFDVVPASVRASAVGVLNLLGATVSGFAPFLGGVVRRNIGVGRLMGFTGGLYLITGLIVVYGTLRYFARDHSRCHSG
jgi:predicted MFS family arabinose efflux permease